MKRVYLAGPFFDDDQIDRIERMEKALAANPTVSEFFSPRTEQHDEFEFGSKEWAKAIYKGDKDHLDPAEVVIAVIDYEGEHVDPGTAWEIGYSEAAKKPVILVKEKDGGITLMMSVPAHAVITDVADVATYDFDALPANEWEGKTF